MKAAQPRNRLREFGTIAPDGVPKLLHCGGGLREDFAHVACGCPGTWCLVMQTKEFKIGPTIYGWVTVPVWDGHVQHSRACREGR
jgi:hypothetical protein